MMSSQILPDLGLGCLHMIGKIFEPQHEISNNVVCATSKASDQRSLIRAFASRLNILCLLGYWPDVILSF